VAPTTLVLGNIGGVQARSIPPTPSPSSLPRRRRRDVCAPEPRARDRAGRRRSLLRGGARYPRSASPRSCRSRSSRRRRAAASAPPRARRIARAKRAPRRRLRAGRHLVGGRRDRARHGRRAHARRRIARLGRAHRGVRRHRPRDAPSFPDDHRHRRRLDAGSRSPRPSPSARTPQGIARPLLKALTADGEDGARRFLDAVEAELRTVMLLVGARTVSALRKAPLVQGGRIARWVSLVSRAR
jgi:hypothetical protein